MQHLQPSLTDAAYAQFKSLNQLERAGKATALTCTAAATSKSGGSGDGGRRGDGIDTGAAAHQETLPT